MPMANVLTLDILRGIHSVRSELALSWMPTSLMELAKKKKKKNESLYEFVQREGQISVTE